MRGGRRASAILLALAGLLVVAVPASWAHELRIQTTLAPGGKTGQLSVASPPGAISWEACTAKLTECVPWGRGFQTETLSAPAGTVFRVRNAEGETGLSPEWTGPLKELAPPRVTGVIQANDYVSPMPGLWSGGWRGEPSEMQLAACETEAGAGCVSLTSPHYERLACEYGAAFYLNPLFSGWYLRVADKQSGGPHAEAGYGISSPSGRTWGFEEVWGRSRAVSVAMVGQIASAVNPPTGECGPPPPPTATISDDGVARVECGGGCSVALLGAYKGRKQLLSRRIPEQDLLRPQAALKMRLSPAALASLGFGKKIRLTVEIDGVRSAQRTIRSSDS